MSINRPVTREQARLIGLLRSQQNEERVLVAINSAASNDLDVTLDTTLFGGVDSLTLTHDPLGGTDFVNSTSERHMYNVTVTHTFSGINASDKYPSLVMQAYKSYTGPTYPSPYSHANGVVAAQTGFLKSDAEQQQTSVTLSTMVILEPTEFFTIEQQGIDSYTYGIATMTITIVEVA